MVVITRPEAIPGVRLTVDEYLQADLPEGSRYELVDGEVQVAPNPDGVHEETIYALNTILMEYRRVHPERIALVSANSGIPIPGRQRVREPDIAVYTRWESKGRRWSVWKDFTPVLVVEVVSPGQEQRDYSDKRDDYWEAGISEYWIVDPDAATVHVLTRGRDTWTERVCGRGETFKAACLSDLTVAVSDVLKGT